jgi:hypothetical protein
MGEAEISSEFEYSASFLRILIPGLISVILATLLILQYYDLDIFENIINVPVWGVLSAGVIFMVLSMFVGLIINVFNTRLTRVLEGYTLGPDPKQYIFSWHEISGKDKEKLLKFLIDDLGIKWAEKARVNKIDETFQVINEEKSIEIKLDKNKNRVIIGDQIYTLKIKEENGKLNICKEKFLFCWDDVPGKDCQKFLKFLKDELGINWTEKAKITKTDDKRTIRISNVERPVDIILDESRTKATLKISSGQICNLHINDESCMLDVYQQKIGFFKGLQWKDFVKCRQEFRSAKQNSIEKSLAYTNLFYYYSDCLYEIAKDPIVKDGDLKEHILPTKLGNVFKSMEIYPTMKYGMNGVFFWTRIQLSMKEENKTSLDKSRAYVDMFVELTWIFIFAAIVYSMVFAFNKSYISSAVSLGIFTIFSYGSYKMAVQSALDFGNYVRSIYDLYRDDLWEEINKGIFDNLGKMNEKERWENIFRYLWFHNLTAQCKTCCKFYDPRATHKCEKPPV